MFATRQAEACEAIEDAMSDTTPPLDLEITVRTAGGQAYTVDLRLDDPASAAPVDLAVGAPVRFDHEALLASALDPLVYGAQLSAMLFADRRMREGWAIAAGYLARGQTPLRLRLRLATDDPALHALRWELLQHPQSGQFLATDERILLSRTLASADAEPVQRRPPGDLRALIVVAAPADLGRYQLAPIDLAAEVSRARVALSALKPTVVAGCADGRRADLATIIGAARDGYDLIYLVAHGAVVDGAPTLYLEDAQGSTAPTPAAALADGLSQLARRPALVALASCQSAGDESAAALSALGPQLIAAGIPAVVAIQGPIEMVSVTRMLPAFFRELQRDGRIDRALAAARALARDLADWWRPILYCRLRDGRIWDDAPPTPAPAVTPITRVGNPFGRVGRIDDTAAIYGRDDLLRRVFEELAKGMSIALVGDRQVGKSSLLTLVRKLGPERLHLPPEAFIALNMQLVDDESDFFEALCAEMGLEPMRGSKLARALRGRQFIVCLDEVEKMANAAAFSGAEREQLRGLADGGSPLRLVIASSTPLERLFPDSEGQTSPLANICQKIDVPPFSPKLAQSFLLNRLEGTGVRFSDAEIEALIRSSGGHPARLQRAAAELFERYVFR